MSIFPKCRPSRAHPALCHPQLEQQAASIFETAGTPISPTTNSLLAGGSPLITGGTQGIGLAVAPAFLAQGCHVIIVGYSKPTLSQPTTNLLAVGANTEARATILVVTDENATLAAAAEPDNPLGRVDIIVRNARILVLNHAFHLPLSNWPGALRVNLTGAFVTARVFDRRTIARKTRERLIFTSKLFGLRKVVGGQPYTFGIKVRNDRSHREHGDLTSPIWHSRNLLGPRPDRNGDPR